MAKYEGGCACGAVRYEVDAEPTFAFHCQCRQCQQVSGTGHTSQFVIPGDALKLSGELKYFDRTSDSGNTMSHGFCPECGSPVVGKTTRNDTIRFIHAGSLDDPALFKPQRVVWTREGQHWDYVDPGLPVS